MTWHSSALFWPSGEGAGNCFPQSLGVNPIRGQHGGPTPSHLRQSCQNKRQTGMCLSGLLGFVHPWLGRQKRETPPTQFDFLITLFEAGSGASVWLCEPRVGELGRQIFDWDSVVVWEDEIVVQTVIIADELTRFYLSEEGSSLHWLSVGLVRHMCSWGNMLFQRWGHGTEDLSQASESLWSHRRLLKDLRLLCLSEFFHRDWEERYFLKLQ